MLFRLADDDRERLGCPEWVEYDVSKLSVREAAALQKHGYKSPTDLWKAWASQYTEDEAGNPTVDHIDFEAWLAVVWMAMYRAGVKVDYDDLDFDINGIETKLSDSEAESEVEAGKDPSTPETTSTS